MPQFDEHQRLHIAYIAYHEFHERALMQDGMHYSTAHDHANAAERQLRMRARGKSLARLAARSRRQFALAFNGEAKAAESYFGNCPRDEEGHCKPSGQGDESGQEKPHADNEDESPESLGGGGVRELTTEDMEIVKESGLASAEDFHALQQLISHKATPEDLKNDTIDLWHGTSIAGAKGIVRRRELKPGQRGTNAAATIDDAAQYPEETGADAMVLLRAKTADLEVDPNDQQGDTVEEGLFPASGYGSAAKIGNHEILAVIDMRTQVNRGPAFEALNKGDLFAALEHGATVLYFAGKL